MLVYRPCILNYGELSIYEKLAIARGSRGLRVNDSGMSPLDTGKKFLGVQQEPQCHVNFPSASKCPASYFKLSLGDFEVSTNLQLAHLSSRLSSSICKFYYLPATWDPEIAPRLGHNYGIQQGDTDLPPRCPPTRDIPHA